MIQAQTQFELIEIGNTWSIALKTSHAQVGKLQVYTGKLPIKNQPSMLGTVKKEGDLLLFTPRFGFQANTDYTAVYLDNTFVFQIPSDQNLPKPGLSALYPSTDTLPSNWLKLYLYFDSPMSAGSVYNHIWVVNEAGDTLERPFVVLEPALWNAARTRLTLWFDPGRIKRELGPYDELGAPLLPNQSYRIQIDPNWKDAWNRPIGLAPEKNCYITSADRLSPVPGQWKLILPKPSTKDPLCIQFGESLDFPLLQNSFTILNEENQIIETEVTVLAQETQLTFTPKKIWESGQYRIQIDAKLEDLAGNNLNRVFDRDLEQEHNLRQIKESWYLTFELPNQ